ncbi:hypothetical protein ACIOMM_30925 [Streptomyces sp. NPDC087908]
MRIYFFGAHWQDAPQPRYPAAQGTAAAMPEPDRDLQGAAKAR